MHAIPITKQKHEVAFADLVVRAYGSDSAREAVASWRAHPGYRRELSRLVYDGDNLVAGAFVRDVAVRVGEAIVPHADIGFPVFDTKRGEDAEAVLMDALLGGLADSGYCLAQVVGDRFRKYGFVGGVVRHSCHIVPAEIEVDTPHGWRDRQMTGDDVDAVADLYTRTIGMHTLAPLYAAEFWRARMESGELADARLVVDSAERLRAYMVVSSQEPARIHEFAVDDDETAAVAALGMLVRYARKHNIDTLAIDALPDNAFARISYERFGAVWQRRMDVRTGPSHCIVAAEPLIRLLQSTLANRWKRRPNATPYATVSVRSSVGRFSIVPSHDSLHVVVGSEVGRPICMPVDVLTRLLLGFDTAERVLSAGDIHATDEAIRVLNAVFSPPHIWRM